MTAPHFTLEDSPSGAREFEFEVRRLADCLVFGSDPSRFVGSGLEYAESRPYEIGDNVRSIDWRVTARTRIPYVKQYDATRQVPVYLLVDNSASMCVSSLERSKYHWAVRIATALARVSQERLSPVGLLTAGDEVLHQAPTLSKGDTMRWAHQLLQYRFDQSTCLGQRLRTLSAAVKTKSMVFVISDFHDPDAIEGLELLAVGHELVALWLQDPAEVEPPKRGFLRGREAETGATFLLSRKTPLSSYLQVHERLSDGGIEFLHLPTDQPIVPRLQYFLRHRKSMGHQ